MLYEVITFQNLQYLQHIQTLGDSEKVAILISYLQLDEITVDPSNHEGQCGSDHLYLIELCFSHEFSGLESCAHF